MKRPTTLLNRVLLNEGLQVSLTVTRDIQEIECRFEHEGMSFLTITLPSLCDALDQGLALGRITPSMYPGFKPSRRGGKLPALLSGFFIRVFEKDGSLKDDPCIDSIRAIRQVTRLFKKVLLPCSAARVHQAFERYHSNDEELLQHCDRYPDPGGIMRIVAGYLWSDLEVLSGELFCSPGGFGSGATAEHLLLNGRYTVREWNERAEPFFPSSYHAVCREDDVDSLSGIKYHPSGSERPVRVVSVPKTLKGPRVISVEPSYVMLMQKSMAIPLMDWLESGRLGFKSIRFSDQSENKELARRGSVDGLLSTIDLKDASDRVSLALVRQIFESCPTFLSFAEACRTSKARLPDGKVLELRKFASMGSAMCFPIEAMVFLTLTVSAIARHHGVKPSRGWITAICKKIAVYGDDIIIPAETAPAVIDYLESFDLRVNRSKSFFTGFFRESCGGDYYKGHDVTPVYVRRWALPGKRLTGPELASYVSLSNQLYVKGLWHASQSVRDFVRDVGNRRIPRTNMPVGGLAYYSVSFNTELRWDSNRHGWRVKVPILVPGKQRDPHRELRGVLLYAFGSRYTQEYLSRISDEVVQTGTPSSVYGSFKPSKELGSPSTGVPFDSYRMDDWRSLRDYSLRVISGDTDTGVSVTPHSVKTKSGWADVFIGVG